MSKLFEKTHVKSLTIPNRFIRSATWEGMATKEGACTQKLTDLMVQLAQGGVGLIITGHAYVRGEGQAGLRQLGVYNDDFIPGLAEMTSAVHKAGGASSCSLRMPAASPTGKSPDRKPGGHL